MICTTTQTDTLPQTTYASQIPKTTTSYDQGIQGTKVAWYNAKGNSLDGAPKLHTTGLISTDKTRLSFDGLRLYIDDQLRADMRLMRATITSCQLNFDF